MNRVRAKEEQHSAGRTKTRGPVYFCFCMKTRPAGSAERFNESRGYPFLNAAFTVVQRRPHRQHALFTRALSEQRYNREV